MAAQGATGDWAVWVNGLPADEFISFVAIAAVAAAAAFYFAFRFFRRARIIEDTPTSKIRSAAQGYLELNGHQELMDGVPIIAPLSGSACTWYRCKVEHRETVHTSKGTRTRWRAVRSETSDALFLIKDDTGQCVIDPEGAEVTSDERMVWYGDTAQPTGPPRGAGRSRFSIATGDYRYTEEMMIDGQPLYAIGLFKTVGGAHDVGSIADDVREILAQWKADQADLVDRFDADGDGKIDMDEWEAARKAARAEALKERAQRSAQAGTNLMTKPAARGRPYLLSVIPQTGLAKRYRLYAGGCVVGFLLAGGFAAAMTGARIML